MIENRMRVFLEEARWESVALFSSEGLLMAKGGASTAYEEEVLLEFAFSLLETARLTGNELPIKEITLKGKERKTLVFRYFNALNDELILAAVVSGRKGYKRALNNLIKEIQNLS